MRVLVFRIFLLTVILGCLTSGHSLAGIPEPESLIFGKVVNTWEGNNVPVTAGTLEWTLREKGGDRRVFTFKTELACLECEDAEPAPDGGCAACRVSYSLAVPQEAAVAIAGMDVSGGAIPLENEERQYDYVTVTVNGLEARIVPKLPDQPYLRASQNIRSAYYEVDLEIVEALGDKDGDGIPDFWEELYGMSPDDPDDANDDPDGDGWTGREEFEHGGDPDIDNRIPDLLNERIVAHEGGSTRFQVHILDSDTPEEAMEVRITGLSEGFRLNLFDWESGKANHELDPGEGFTGQDMRDGRVLLEHTGDTGKTPSVDLLLDDGDHEPVAVTLLLEVFRPTATDGTEAIYWADAWTYKRELDAEEAEDWALPDRSGNAYNGTAEPWETLVFDGTPSPSGKRALNREGTGWVELPYGEPIFPDGESTVISVFRSTGTEEQILASGPYFDIGVTGENHPSHPGEVRVATSASAVYGNRDVKNEWVLSTVRRKGGMTEIDVNGLWAGGPFFLNEVTHLGSDPVLGGKNDWTWNFTLQEWEFKASKQFEGQLAEILVYDKHLPETKRWRVDAYLFSKWFGHVVSDFTRASKPVTVKSRNEGIKWMAQKAYYRYLARLAALDVETALEELEEYFSEEWSWSTQYPSEEDVWQEFYQLVRDESVPYFWERLLPVYKYLAALDPQKFTDALVEFEAFLPENWSWSGEPPSEEEATEAFLSIVFLDYKQVLLGGLGDDHLTAGFEDDILVGGPGADTLKGLGGRDIFVVTDGDHIVDFNREEGDVLHIAGLLTQPGRPLGDYVHFEILQDAEFEDNHTLLKIDANGDGSGYEDAVITIKSVVLRDTDLNGLWADGHLQTGGVRPALRVDLESMMSQAREVTGESARFRVSFSGCPAPEGLSVSLGLAGDAVPGEDYHLETPVYNEKTGEYETLRFASLIPVRLKPGDSSLVVRVVPVLDHISEPDEELVVTLVPKEDRYDISADQTVEISIGDGPDQVSISSSVAAVFEVDERQGEIRLTRQGSTDVPRIVKLLVNGSADNGKDYRYIPSEIHFPAGKTEAKITVQAYEDLTQEPDEFVEVVIDPGDGYAVRGPASATVRIADGVKPQLCGDLDRNGRIDLQDALLAIQVCTGMAPSGVHPEMATTADRKVDARSLIYILQVISEKRAMTKAGH